jgi:hypothetical protein
MQKSKPEDRNTTIRRVEFDYFKSLVPLILQREKLANIEERKDVMKEEMSQWKQVCFFKKNFWN